MINEVKVDVVEHDDDSNHIDEIDRGWCRLLGTRQAQVCVGGYKFNLPTLRQ